MNTAIDFELLFKSLLNKLGSDVLAIDPQGKILFWERGFAGAGPAPQEVIGQHLMDVYPQLGSSEEDIDWELEIFTHVLQEGRPVEVRRQSRQVGKRTFWFDVMAYPLRDGQETILGAVLVILDVSDRQALEEKLIRQARTQSLANLGASIAHEIRNPLNAMSLNIQLVREAIKKIDEPSLEHQTQNLDLILEEITRLDSIVSNFLQFARPPQTSLSLDDPNRAVENVVQMLQEQARKKGVELTTQCHTVPEVLMDRNRLVEAIYNLTQNALQELSEGGKINLVTRVEKDHILIEIHDNGPGIPSDMQDKIFELYFSTKKEDGHGTGLGLPYADSIVKAHNGNLTVHSTVGQGSTFTIKLPRSIITGKQS